MTEHFCRVYIASASPLSDSALYEKALTAVNDYRRVKAERLNDGFKKRQSLAAGLLLRYALKDCGITEDEQIFSLGEYGKPFLQGRDIDFCLSHSDNIVMCAVSSHTVGCDIEKVRSFDPRTAKRMFSPREYEHISTQATSAESIDLFFRYWVLKESFMKATGFGMYLPFCDFDIDLSQKNIRVIQNADKREFGFAEYPVSDFKCALCLCGDFFPKKLIEVSLENCI